MIRPNLKSFGVAELELLALKLALKTDFIEGIPVLSMLLIIKQNELNNCRILGQSASSQKTSRG